MRNPAFIPCHAPIIADIALIFASHPRINAKEKTQILYQYLSPLVVRETGLEQLRISPKAPEIWGFLCFCVSFFKSCVSHLQGSHDRFKFKYK